MELSFAGSRCRRRRLVARSRCGRAVRISRRTRQGNLADPAASRPSQAGRSASCSRLAPRRGRSSSRERFLSSPTTAPRHRRRVARAGGGRLPAGKPPRAALDRQPLARSARQLPLAQAAGRGRVGPAARSWVSTAILLHPGLSARARTIIGSARGLDVCRSARCSAYRSGRQRQSVSAGRRDDGGLALAGRGYAPRRGDSSRAVRAHRAAARMSLVADVAPRGASGGMKHPHSGYTRTHASISEKTMNRILAHSRAPSPCARRRRHTPRRTARRSRPRASWPPTRACSNRSRPTSAAASSTQIRTRNACCGSIAGGTSPWCSRRASTESWP